MSLEVIQAGEEGPAALGPSYSGLQLSDQWLIGFEQSPAVIVSCHFSYDHLYTYTTNASVTGHCAQTYMYMIFS